METLSVSDALNTQKNCNTVSGGKVYAAYEVKDNLYSFPEKPVEQSSSVLISRQHLTLPVFPPCRLGLHFLDSPTDCWDVQRSWKYLCTQLCLVPMHHSGCVSKQRTSSKLGPCASWSWHPARQGGGSPKSACQALKENTTRSFNSDHETQPRGPVKWRFGCASRQFASFYRLVIWNGRPRGNLKCWKLNWYCCGAAQSHLHLTPFCWYNHIPAGVCLRPQRSFKMQSTGRKSHHLHQISPVFKLTCAFGSQLWKLVHQETRKYTRNPHFFVIQLRDSKREARRRIY